MPAIINTNIASLNAQRNLNTSQSALQTSLQRLSSGLRINSAKDDAAGMAISDRMTSQIRGNAQAARNANDGISLSQTAEGALAEVSNNLQRIRELAIQSANATNSASDRATLQAEVSQLLAEIDRVAQNTSFNGVKLLDGSFTAQTFQVGANGTANDRIQISSIANSRTTQLGGVGATSAATVTSGVTTAALSAGDLTLNGQQVGASVAGAAPGQSTSSAYAVANAINAVSPDSGVTATANATTVTGSAATDFTAIAADTFSINGINVGAVAAGTTAAGQGANLAASINAIATQTGVAASANATTGAVTLTANDGRDISIAFVSNAADAATETTNRTTFLAQTGLATGTVGQQGVAAVAGTVITAGAVVTPPFAGSTLASGALTANGASIGAVTYGTAAYTAATAAAASTTDSANVTFAAGGLTSGSTYTFTVGGTGNTGVITLVGTGNETTDAQAFRTAYAALGADTLGGAAAILATTATKTFSLEVTSVRTAAEVTAGVSSGFAVVAATSAIATSNAAVVSVSNGTLGTQASNGAQYSGQQFALALNTALAAATGGAAVNGTATFTAGTGAVSYVAGSTDSLQIAIAGTATNGAAALATQTALSTATGLTTGQLGLQAVAASAAANHGTVTLNSTSANGIVIGGAAVANAGLTTGTTAATTVSSVSAISAVDVSTASGATTALTAIDGALTTVNSARANLGAIQNRFSSVVSSLGTTVENLTASRSRIVDTDFAAETAQLTRAQILQQAGTAMLAQANAIPNTVLTLLR